VGVPLGWLLGDWGVTLGVVGVVTPGSVGVVTPGTVGVFTPGAVGVLGNGDFDEDPGDGVEPAFVGRLAAAWVGGDAVSTPGGQALALVSGPCSPGGAPPGSGTQPPGFDGSASLTPG
jgi:hypothetical protein